VILKQQDRIKDAMKCFGMALMLNPANANSWLRTGDALISQQLRDAQIYLEKTLGLYPVLSLLC
jgi:tetratricopeptide (TPR) repeat protein